MRIICAAELFLGAFIMMLSIFRYRDMLRGYRKAHEIKAFSKPIYSICMGLMVFFFLGYIVMGTFYLLFVKELHSANLLVSNIFLFGALFVFLVVYIQVDMFRNINGRTEEIIMTLVNAVEAKDEYTRGHSEHVQQLADLLYLHMPGPLRGTVNYPRLLDAAILHDIGKIGIPDTILNKCGSLTEEEMAVIHQHPLVGKQILENTSFQELGEIIMYHHERIDGQGYYGLPAAQVPVESRMIAIADTFSALYSDRCYRPRKSYEEAMEVLSSVAGTQLDAELVKDFAAIPRERIDAVTDMVFFLHQPVEI